MDSPNIINSYPSQIYEIQKSTILPFLSHGRSWFGLPRSRDRIRAPERPLLRRVRGRCLGRVVLWSLQFFNQVYGEWVGFGTVWFTELSWSLTFPDFTKIVRFMVDIYQTVVTMVDKLTRISGGHCIVPTPCSSQLLADLIFDFTLRPTGAFPGFDPLSFKNGWLLSLLSHF